MSNAYPKDTREALESPIIQGTAEAIAYTFDFTNCGVTSITAQTAVVYLDGANVTSTVMPSGTASAAGLIVTTPKLTALTEGKIYHMYARVTHDGGQVTELFCRVIARA